MPNFISEDQIEQAVLELLHQRFGFELLNCFTGNREDLNDRSNRRDKRDVIFEDRLKAAALRLNPGIPENVVDDALGRLTDKRQAMSAIGANREIDALIRDGIPVEFEDAKKSKEQACKEQAQLKVIDFNHPDQNQFLAVSQLWIRGDINYRRPDILLYVNGLPLVFIELKNSNVKLKSAFDDNLTTYKYDIPQLFLTNAFCILSNAGETLVGSFTAGWEHFFNWLRVADEKETVDRKKIRQQGTSLETAAMGLCNPVNLLNYIENFIIYHKQTQKIIAMNHQFMGVNNAFGVFRDGGRQQGKLGVFWHTQGSGKSFSMIFYVRKILRKLAGNFTFVVITDRDDLDGQIYRNFLNTGTVKEHEAAQPKNSGEMRKFLGLNKRIVFTLIQKFRYDKGREYPVLSDRSDIIVIVDEAHRTQYKTLAENMRKGLPNAQFLAFTGTPLLGRDRKTNEWFGDYVSEFNFQQSMDEGATVPLFYQKRVPEVLIQNEDLSEEFYEILEDDNLDEIGQAKLEKKFAKEIEVIKRDDRLETIARDIVYHFPRRGYLGKGMVISVDKFTTVRMYDKVNHYWKAQLKTLRGRIKKSDNEIEKSRLKKIVETMRRVDMAVVVSAEAGEEDKFSTQGLAIKPHRTRMDQVDQHGHDLEYNFKDSEHPLQLVFVCAMWLTRFDAPTLSTLYLDKPQKDHTLMQTIARANRVTSFKINNVAKRNGEIIDYYNVFRNMKKALKDYAQGADDTTVPPVRDKAALFEMLNDAVGRGLRFCTDLEINLPAILEKQNVFKNIGLFNDYADILLGNETSRKSFNVYENTISSLYEACKPEVLGRDTGKMVAVFQYLRGVMDSIVDAQDIDAVTVRISELLDESVVVDKPDDFIAAQGKPAFQIVQTGKTWDLGKIDYEKLKADFKSNPYKNIEIADLGAFIERKIRQMLEQNMTRIDFAQKLQEVIDDYNAGNTSNENYFDELVNLAKALKDEDERAIREGLTQDELELYDLLKKPKMTKKEKKAVKLAAKSLLKRLLEERPRVLVQDWYKDSQTQKIVRSAMEQVLNDRLPETYDRLLFKEKCDNVFDMVLQYAVKGFPDTEDCPFSHGAGFERPIAGDLRSVIVQGKM
jgi:type I restriction enzyme R subunit